MSALPPPGPQRTRLVALLTLLGVAVVFFVWRTSGSSSTPPAAAPPAASNQQGAQQARAGAQGKPAAGPMMPVPVNLDKLEPVPDEPGGGRNLFRFGVPPPPPTPPPPAFKPIEAPPPPKPVDLGPPPIELQLKGIYKQGPDTPSVAYFKDPKAPPDSRMLSGSEGEIVDGKYKLLKVGTESVIVSYVDGTGRKTILISR